MRSGALTLLAGLALGVACAQAAEAPTAFSASVTGVVPEWRAEEWRRGVLKLHPSKFTWQSDVYLELQPEEPASGRTAEAALRTAWGNEEVDDQTVDMTGATELAPGVLARRMRWKYGFDDNLSAWGVATTPRGFVPFHLNCEYANPNHGGGEACLRSAVALIVAIRLGRLQVPEPPTPLNVAGWDGQYLADGRSLAVRSSFNGLRRATITVTPPQRIAAAALRAATERFADSIRDERDKAPSPAVWVNTTATSWLRRGFPDAFEGPALQLAGPVALADGQVAFVGVRCPNPRWVKDCAAGVTQTVQEVASGEVERRRQATIAATQAPLPRDGLQDADIAGLYTEGRHTVGAGGFMTGYVIDGSLYLRDGSVRRDFDRPPALINRSRDDPKQWGTWRRDGDRLTITWSDGKTEQVDVTGSNLMVGGPEGMRLDGRYRHVSGGGTMAFGGGSSFLAEQEYRFHPDFTFESGRSSSFLVGPGPASEGATASGGNTGPGIVGRYAIDGYTMTLTYPDGRISRLAFAAYAHQLADPERAGVMLNGTYYFRDAR